MGRRRVHLRHEHGFTLVEVLATIIIMGIVLAIATSTWFRVVESRRVDSATNQLAADLRLAHTRATNRLAPQQVTLTTGSSEYTVTGAGTLDLDDSDEDLVVVDTTVTIAFCPNGSAEIPPSTPVCSVGSVGPPTTITISSTGDASNNHTIEILPITSRIKVVP